MLKPILIALLICSCVASRPVFPTNTEDERHWKQQYRDGEITWSQYQSLLQTEEKPVKK